MNFSTGSIHNIRSISQQSLAVYWQKLCGRLQRIPSFQEFQPGDRIHDPKQLAVWKVEQAEEQPTCRALYRGRLLDDAFNNSWIGKTLPEVTPLPLREKIVGASNECVRTGRPVYMVIRTYDSAEHAVDLERLLLPFGENGQVRHIVASLQLISLEGSFERQTVAQRFEARADCVLCISIPLNP